MDTGAPQSVAVPSPSHSAQQKKPRVFKQCPRQSSPGPDSSPTHSSNATNKFNNTGPLPSHNSQQAMARVFRQRTRQPSSGSDGSPSHSTVTANKIIVTGYPNYTQSSDIVRAFSRFGAVTVDNLTSKFAILSFSNKEEASAAASRSAPLVLYGQYLDVKAITGRQLPDAARPQRMRKHDFIKATQKTDTMVQPGAIDFSGDFHEQLDKVLAAIRLTQEYIKALGQLYIDVELAMQQLWPGCVAIPFGSITTGLAVKSSDADCFVNIPLQYWIGTPNFVQRAKQILLQNPKLFSEILSIPRANTPIVKFFHNPTAINCDLTFKTALGTRNSKLVAFLLHADPRLLPMAVLIKYWARVQGFSGSGKLTNYALTMMLIFYLQQSKVGILPSVEWLQRNEANDVIVDNWNTGFMNQIEYLPPTNNKQTISELIGGFFEYYAKFNYSEMVICPFLGMPVKKECFKNPQQLPVPFDRYKRNIECAYTLPLKFSQTICVQDPFEQCHNVASGVMVRMANDIKSHFKFASAIYEKEKNYNCRNLLKRILLEKPKLVRGKMHPGFRVSIYPKMIVGIVNPDWKYVVRNVVLTAFKMLKIKLCRVKEPLNAESKKEKKKYSGVLIKPVWKRNGPMKLYNEIHAGFQRREELITEEIFKYEKVSYNIHFNLTIVYNVSLKCCNVTAKFVSGDLEQFREFGKFFSSVMLTWLTELLKLQKKQKGKNISQEMAADTLIVTSSDSDLNENSSDTDNE